MATSAVVAVDCRTAGSDVVVVVVAAVTASWHLKANIHLFCSTNSNVAAAVAVAVAVDVDVDVDVVGVVVGGAVEHGDVDNEVDAVVVVVVVVVVDDDDATVGADDAVRTDGGVAGWLRRES